MCLPYKSIENTLEKGEIARNEQFLFVPQCFLPVWRILCYFYWIWNCSLQTLLVWKSLKFVVWERVNSTTQQNFILVQIQGICRKLNKCDLKAEICFWKGRKHCGKRRKCWLPVSCSYGKQRVHRLWCLLPSLCLFTSLLNHSIIIGGKTVYWLILGSYDFLVNYFMITHFSFSQSVFFSIKVRHCYFSNIEIVVCKCFRFGHVKSFVIW